MTKSKAKVLFYDIGNYDLWIRKDGAVSIISKHPRNAGNELAQWFTKCGYLRTKLDSKTRTVHSIVAEAVYGPRPPGLVINHKDGNKLNNHPDNLEYCSQAYNIKHSLLHGFHVANNPERNGNYKDGRALNRKEYKNKHYKDNIEIYKSRASKYYYENRERILEERKLKYKESISG